MAWQLANEPRPMRPYAINDYKNFIKKSAALIKSMDPNHLVSLGVEGYMGTENLEVFESIHDDKNVDYLTIHIWPKNWAWFTGKEMGPHMDTILGKTMQYIYEHENIARKLNKPLVIEEFGMPRNGISFNIDTPVTYRDIYFKTILNEWAKNKHGNSVLAGINFWAYGGTAQPIKDQLFWKKGDPYMGDPPMEEQGLYSVFNSDTTTWKVIEDAAKNNHEILNDLPSDTMATAKTVSLYRNLKTLLTKGFMFGHQDDLAYGVGWRNVEGKSDVKEITGEYPGVYGWELGNIEHDSAHNIDGIPFNKMKEYIRTGYERGGVISISWHADNPLNLKSAWDTTPGSVAAILPGGPKHAVYKNWLDKIAAFLSDLKDKDGEPIPVLFRPFHEFTGNWFWWCRNNTSADEFKSLWKFTIGYLRDERNLHHILYVYNTADFDSPAAYLEYYPGDDLVDVLSFDIYQTGDPDTDSSFYKRLTQQLGILDNIALQKNKIPAVAETGFDNIPHKTWWTKTLLPALQVHRVSFVLVWRNAGLMNSGKMHYYVPYKEDISAQDFIKFYNSPGVLFEKKTKAAKLYQPLSIK